MNEPSSDSAGSTRRKFLGVGALVAIVGIIIAAIAKNNNGGTTSQSGPASSVNKAVSVIWAPTKLGDISFDAPFAFTPGPDITAQLPAKTRDVLENYEVFESDSQNPHIKISRITYKRGTEINIDAAMNGAIRAVATATGNSDPQFTPTVTSVDGLTASQATYFGKSNDKALRVDALFIQNGQKMWQIQVISIGSSTFDTQRFLDSIQINSKK